MTYMDRLITISTCASAGVPLSWFSGNLLAILAPQDPSLQAVAVFLNQGVLGACVVVLGVTVVLMARTILRLFNERTADFKASQELLASEREAFQEKLAERDRDWTATVRDITREQTQLAREMVAVSTRMVEATEECRRLRR